MIGIRAVAAISITMVSMALGSPASATCTVPNVLTNGQVADASQVMDNFNSVAACNDDSVTIGGAASPGEIAVFNGPQAVTSGNLSGDVTTAGSTATTLSATGVTPGTYTHSSITVDAKGRITSATSGEVASAGASYTKFVVTTPGDAFIDVKLDNDNGYAYNVMVKGYTSANALLQFRISSDNGTTFYSGSSDYKYASIGQASYIGLSSTSSLGAGRITIVNFTIAGMNVVATEKFALTGTLWSVSSAPSNLNGTMGGHNNALAAGNFNAFRVFVSAGNMNDMAVYVQRTY